MFLDEFVVDGVGKDLHHPVKNSEIDAIAIAVTQVIALLYPLFLL